MALTVAIAGVGVSVQLHCRLLQHSPQREFNSGSSSAPVAAATVISPPVSKESIIIFVLCQVMLLVDCSWKLECEDKHLVSRPKDVPFGIWGLQANCCLA